MEVHQETIPSAPSVLVINGVDHVLSNIYAGYLEITRARVLWVRPALLWSLAVSLGLQAATGERWFAAAYLGLLAVLLAVRLIFRFVGFSIRPESIRVTHRTDESAKLLVTCGIRQPFTAIVHPRMAEYLEEQSPNRRRLGLIRRSRVPAQLTDALAKRCDRFVAGAGVALLVFLELIILRLYFRS